MPSGVLAYDNLTTHPALTSEMVKLYNEHYSPKLLEQERLWLMEGSQKEDEPVFRTLNHFYDPIYQRALNAEINAGILTPFLAVLKPFIKTQKNGRKILLLRLIF